ncbi:MAG: DUF1801 domain-containing protein [Proteobacteria bacterium]|nr:DUF1801 domain-containing protein [Pseudomonadota bacterium]
MAANKTVPTSISPGAFLKAVADPQQRKDTQVLHRMMREITGKRAKMWGDSIVGYGSYHYRYDSGREGDFLLTGFSPRKQNISVYIMPGFSAYAGLMKKLGRHKTGKSCLYIKTLEDIDLDVLRQLIKQSVSDMQQMYPTS